MNITFQIRLAVALVTALVTHTLYESYLAQTRDIHLGEIGPMVLETVYTISKLSFTL